jgi:hypothetical protein
LSHVITAALALLLTAPPQSVFACAACFGRSDSKMAEGMNMGIFSLLAVITCVLGGVAAFFIYLAKRSAMAADASLAQPLPQPTEKV